MRQNKQQTKKTETACLFVPWLVASFLRIDDTSAKCTIKTLVCLWVSFISSITTILHKHENVCAAALLIGEKGLIIIIVIRGEEGWKV